MMKIKNLLLIISFLGISGAYAQETDTTKSTRQLSIHAGYYAAFVSQIGVRAGLSFAFKSWSKTTKNQETRIHRLDITPRLGYFTNPDVQKNYIPDITLEYKWYKPTRKIHPKIGLGLGYMLVRQNIGGSVNLANGDISFDKRTLNFFVPTLNIGFEKNREQLIGYYFSAFYGRKFTGQEVNSGFAGAEFGIIFNLKQQ